MPTGKRGSGPSGAARKAVEKFHRRRGPYKLSDEERQRRSDQLKAQHAAGRMVRKKSIDEMSDGELDAFIERKCAELGLTRQEAERRYLQDPEQPANTTTSPPDSASDSALHSSAFANPREEDDTTDPMVSSDDPFETDPIRRAEFEQTKRELRGQASDEEQQAARAFLPHLEPASSYMTSHETELALRAIYARHRGR